ncbi:MAG TPA: hypothetical protein VG454_07425 [Gemmatimonadales bacterium]|nr:hypothetical protein [Gemmatimonadales bacterium]
MGTRLMRYKHLTRSTVVRTLIMLVITGCESGSGILGMIPGNGGLAINGGGGNGSSGVVLSFFGQPSSATAGQTLAPIVVGAIDSVSRLDTTFSGAITITLGANTTGAGLGGTTTVRAASGVATFGNLTIDKAGSYTLQASASGATSVTSAPFTIRSVTTP